MFAHTAKAQTKTIGLKRRAAPGASLRGGPGADIRLATAVSEGTIQPGAEPAKSAGGTVPWNERHASAVLQPSYRKWKKSGVMGQGRSADCGCRIVAEVLFPRGATSITKQSYCFSKKIVGDNPFPRFSGFPPQLPSIKLPPHSPYRQKRPFSSKHF